MLEQPEGALPGALLEARLHRPRLLDHCLEPSWNGESGSLLFENAIHCRKQRWNRPVAFCLGVIPCLEDLLPEQRREQERRRYRLAEAHTLVGISQRQLDEALAERLLEEDVEARGQGVRESVLAQTLERLDGMTRKEKLLHLVEQPGRRHVLDQRRERWNGRCRFLFDAQ